jgi:hypothetical protein
MSVGTDTDMRLAQARKLSLRRWRAKAKFSPKSLSALAADAGSWSAAREGFGITQTLT